MQDTPVKAGYAVTIAPAPPWVVPLPAPAGAPGEASPMHYRVIDSQTRVEAGSNATYWQVVRVVNQPAGLGPAAQFEVEYDPSYESVVLHGLDIVRGGQRLARLDRNRIELLQREKQLEQRIYDGRISVSIVLDDVRLGDELDLRYTIVGANPVFGGKFVRNEWMVRDRGPIRLIRARLLAPAERRIRHVAGPQIVVASEVSNGWRDTTFVREQVPQLRAEPGAAASSFQGDTVQFSEFADWAEVAAWGDRLFAGAASGAQTSERAAAIQASHRTPTAQVLESLRFVQQDVRYFGIELGLGSHKPNASDQVLQQRFGDCKDKVTLLSALLRALQVPVRPVLVSTQWRGRVGSQLPSPLAFDHVIARVDVDGQRLYLDPTWAHQSGPLQARQTVGLGQGLELAPDTTALAALPTDLDTERLRVEDRFIVRAFAEPVTLESRIVYRGRFAEGVREGLATQGTAAVAEAASAQYFRLYPRLRRTAAATSEPVEGDDAVAIVQRFELPGFWRFPDEKLLVTDVGMWAVADVLMAPKMERRSQALAFGLPGISRHFITIEFPEDISRNADTQRSVEEGDNHFRLQIRQSATPRSVVTTAELRIGTDEVAADQWPGFVSASNKALSRLSATVSVPPVPLSLLDGLQKRLREIDEDLRRGRVTARTGTQAQARFKTSVLTTQIAGGRLDDRLKAQALVARGIAHDNTGYRDLARADFEAAMKLDPDSVEALNGAATNAQGSGSYDRAVELADRVLSKVPGNSQALGTRAWANYLAGRLEAAQKDWSAMLEGGGPSAGYPLAMLALATRRLGGDLNALRHRYPESQWPSAWPRPLVDMAFNGDDRNTLLDAAKAQRNIAEAQTEAFFYLGELAAAAGDAGKAQQHWRRAVDLGVVEFVEHSASQLRLRSVR